MVAGFNFSYIFKNAILPICFLWISVSEYITTKLKAMFYSVRFWWILCMLVSFGCISGMVGQEPLKFDHLTTDDGLSQNSIYGIVKDKYGFMWFGTWEGVCRFDGYRFIVFRADENNERAITNNRINRIVKDSQQNIWILTADGRNICRYNYDTEDFSRFPPDKVAKNVLDSLHREHFPGLLHAENKLYSWRIIASDGGLSERNKQTGIARTYNAVKFNRWSFNDNNITDLYLDDHDIFWVGTLNGGIQKADTRPKPFRYYYSTPNLRTGIVDNVVKAICQDRAGNIWIGTSNKGVTRLDRTRTIFTHFQHSSSNANSIVSNEIRSIYCDKAGYLWIGTKRGLDRLDPSIPKFYHYSVDGRYPIPHNWVFDVMEDHLGNLWIATFNGIAKYNRGKDSFTGFDAMTTLKNRSARTVIEDRNHKLWVGTEGGGITCLSRDFSEGLEEKLTSVHYTYSASNTNSLINNQVLALLEDKEGMIWIGTNGGLCRLNPSKGIFTRFSIKNGLPDDLIMGLLTDKLGNIWVSHKKGLTCICTKNFTMRNFDLHDGLQGKEFNQNAYYCDKGSGEMFFGGANGFNSFFPDSLTSNPFLPKVVLTGLEVMNQPVKINQSVNGRVILKKSMVMTDTIVFDYQNSSFAVEFAALHYSNPNKNKYRYRLAGLDTCWIATDASNRKASYSNLSPGKYQLQVMGSNCDGLWNPTPAKLTIVILAPWWRTGWVYAFYLAIIIAATMFLRRFFVDWAKGPEIKSSEKVFIKEGQKLPGHDSPIHADNVVVNVTDEAFVGKLKAIIDANIANTEFDADTLAAKLKISRAQLYRKTKMITNQTVYDLITAQRMNKAAELLLGGDNTISEVAYLVGYSLPTNFTRAFVKQFGETPSNYIASFKKGE
jgi:ligand-binding sensor domain-containing protein/AraC-like DNA-binding protein